MKMLPPFYQIHLENQLSRSELLFLALLINVLQHLKQVSLEKIANALPLPILFESRRKKVQRFLSQPNLNIPNIWFPILQNWLADNFTGNQTLYLVIDRTKWERKNLLMISLVYDHRAIPIYFEALGKFGNSDFSVQSQLFSQVLPLFKNYRVVVLGDREFCSVKLANWLREQGVQFCLRLKKMNLFKLKMEFGKT